MSSWMECPECKSDSIPCLCPHTVEGPWTQKELDEAREEARRLGDKIGWK